MRDIIVDGKIVKDEWHFVEKDAAANQDTPHTNALLPLSAWLAQREQLRGRSDIGVWLDSDEDPAQLEDDLDTLPVIGIHFPSFRDGRGYSSAVLLRQRYGYQGQLRALGDVLKDQLFYMKRCGINAFVTRVDRDIHRALTSLNDFTLTYQGAIDQPQPLFRRRIQGGL